MKYWKAILAGLAAFGVAFLVLMGRKQPEKRTSAVVEQQAQNAKTQMEENLEKIPAPDLVDGDPRAAELRHLTDGVKADTRTKIRDSIAELRAGRLDRNAGVAIPRGSHSGREDH